MQLAALTQGGRRLWVWLCGHSSRGSPHRTCPELVWHPSPAAPDDRITPITTNRCTVPRLGGDGISEFSLVSHAALVSISAGSPQCEKRRSRGEAAGRPRGGHRDAGVREQQEHSGQRPPRASGRPAPPPGRGAR